MPQRQNPFQAIGPCVQPRRHPFAGDTQAASIFALDLAAATGGAGAKAIPRLTEGCRALGTDVHRSRSPTCRSQDPQRIAPVMLAGQVPGRAAAHRRRGKIDVVRSPT
jgi:hypothetical protein